MPMWPNPFMGQPMMPAISPLSVSTMPAALSVATHHAGLNFTMQPAIAPHHAGLTLSMYHAHAAPGPRDWSPRGKSGLILEKLY